MKDITRWVGVQPTEPEQVFTIVEPPYECNYVFESLSVENATTILYTVTAGRTLHLTTWYLNVNGVAAGEAQLYVRNVADVLQYYLATLPVAVGVKDHDGLSYPISVEIPAGYDVVIRSTAANVYVNGHICGYERAD